MFRLRQSTAPEESDGAVLLGHLHHGGDVLHHALAVHGHGLANQRGVLLPWTNQRPVFTCPWASSRSTTRAASWLSVTTRVWAKIS